MEDEEEADLQELAGRVADLSPQELLGICRSSLRAPVQQLLCDIGDLLPFVEALGGEVAVVEVARAVLEMRDV